LITTDRRRAAIAFARTGQTAKWGANVTNDLQAWFPFQRAFEHFTIDPRTSWDRLFNPQLFISLNSADAGIENQVLGEVGSYGRQLGRVIDVLEVLVARLDPAELTPLERRSVDRFKELASDVETAVTKATGTRPAGITLGDVDDLVAGLASLARSDPAAHRRLVERLRGALADPTEETKPIQP
jgi:hypothetical protein